MSFAQIPTSVPALVLTQQLLARPLLPAAFCAAAKRQIIRATACLHICGCVIEHGCSAAVCLQVCRGTAVTIVAPTAGAEEIANPFMQAAEEQ
jgi:hypothetical protein